MEIVSIWNSVYKRLSTEKILGASNRVKLLIYSCGFPCTFTHMKFFEWVKPMYVSFLGVLISILASLIPEVIPVFIPKLILRVISALGAVIARLGTLWQHQASGRKSDSIKQTGEELYKKVKDLEDQNKLLTEELSKLTGSNTIPIVEATFVHDFVASMRQRHQETLVRVISTGLFLF